MNSSFDIHSKSVEQLRVKHALLNTMLNQGHKQGIKGTKKSWIARQFTWKIPWCHPKRESLVKHALVDLRDEFPLLGCLQVEFKGQANHLIWKKSPTQRPVFLVPNLLHIHVTCICTSPLPPSYHSLLTISWSSSTGGTFMPLQIFTGWSPPHCAPCTKCIGMMLSSFSLCCYSQEGGKRNPSNNLVPKNPNITQGSHVIDSTKPSTPHSAMPCCAISLSSYSFFSSLIFWVA